MFEDAAHLTVLAFRQRQLDPLVASGTAFEVGVDLAVADAVDGDALDQILELRLADVAEGARAIGALDPARGQFALPLERAAVGEAHDRKRVGEGKGGSVRVSRGWCR